MKTLLSLVVALGFATASEACNTVAVQCVGAAVVQQQVVVPQVAVQSHVQAFAVPQVQAFAVPHVAVQSFAVQTFAVPQAVVVQNVRVRQQHVRPSVTRIRIRQR